jgi:hypothetical protein
MLFQQLVRNVLSTGLACSKFVKTSCDNAASTISQQNVFEIAM